MARISIYYDDVEKEQFFMVRGDERYARSTKTLLSIGTPSLDITSFDVSATVNVLRDTGEGQVVIYDNDDVVYVISDWDSTDDERAVLLEGLGYEQDHKFMAEYIGNDESQRSSSNIIPLWVEDTNRLASAVSITVGQQFNPSTTTNVDVTLSIIGEGNHDYLNEQDIDIVYDGTLIDTITTSDDGTGYASFELDVGNTGRHTLTASFHGTEHLNQSSAQKTISVGYTFGNINKPQFLFDSIASSFSATLTSFNNVVVPSQSVTFDYLDGGSWETISTGLTDSNGVFSTSFTPEGLSDTEIKVRFVTEINSNTYVSNVITIPYIVPTVLDITSSTPVLSENNLTTFTIQTNSTVEGTPVSITGDATYSLFTNSQGAASFSYEGDGYGTKIFTASFGNLTDTIEIEDYLQYWTPNAIYNRAYLSIGNQVSILDLNNLFRIEIPRGVGSPPYTPYESTSRLLFLKNVPENAVLNFDSFSTNKACRLVVPEAQINIQGDTVNINYWNANVTELTRKTYSNAKITFTKENNVLSLYENNALITQKQFIGNCIPLYVYNDASSSDNSVNVDFPKLTIEGL